MPVKFKEHHYSVDFPVYKYRMFFIYTNDLKRSREAISGKVGLFRENFEQTDALHSYNPNVPDSFIFFTEEATAGWLAHEIFHALWQMFSYFNIKLDNENVAYHLNYILDLVIEFKSKTDGNHKARNGKLLK